LAYSAQGLKEQPMTDDTLVLSAGHQLRALAASLADQVVAREFGRRPELRTRYGPAGRTKSREGAECHLLYLADAVDTGSAVLFNDYIGWVKALLLPRGLRSEDLDHQLVCMAEVVHDRLPAPVAAPAVAMIEAARVALPFMPDTTASFFDTRQRLSSLARDYMHTLLGGERQGAARLVFDAADRGESARELYLQVFQPALREIGRLWQANRMSVSQEHFCSISTQILMSQLLAHDELAERGNGGSVVVACVSGELHDVGARMVADFFEMAGWRTYFCGANTPHGATVQALVERGADVLAASTTMGCRLHHAKELIDRVRAEPRCAGVRIMVGGYPFMVDPTLCLAVGADGTAGDAEAAVALAGQWRAPKSPST
jgi:methanogenic corrinoid protein MtbC1